MRVREKDLIIEILAGILDRAGCELEWTGERWMVERLGLSVALGVEVWGQWICRTASVGWVGKRSLGPRCGMRSGALLDRTGGFDTDAILLLSSREYLQEILGLCCAPVCASPQMPFELDLV